MCLLDSRIMQIVPLIYMKFSEYLRKENFSLKFSEDIMFSRFSWRFTPSDSSLTPRCQILILLTAHFEAAGCRNQPVTLTQPWNLKGFWEQPEGMWFEERSIITCVRPFQLDLSPERQDVVVTICGPAEQDKVVDFARQKKEVSLLRRHANKLTC